MTCKCVEVVNAKLAERNTRLTQPMLLSGEAGDPPVMIETHQIETGRGKKKAISVFATYCPFCGKAYKEETP